MAEFTMPSLGADMEAGTLVEWKIKPGDVVNRGDIVAVVETDKGAIEIEIFEAGRVDALLVEPGAKVPVGTALARIGGAGEAPAGPAASAGPAPAREAPAATPPAPSTPPAAPSPAPAAPSLPAAPGPAAAPPARPRASPAARVRALELGVPLEQVPGTGPGGAITRDDVERSAQKPLMPKAPPARPGMRHAIAAAMSRSKREIPHYYLATRIDVSPALTWLQAHNAGREPARRVLPVALWLKAVALATQHVPELNGFFENGEFRAANGVHIGVAVSLREGGLLVPALHDVDAKSIDALSAELADVIERARRGQLKSSELSDATLTVTSLGERGVETVFGVIFPPQVALVGLGKVLETALVVDGACVPRRTIQATLAADHRVSDGHRGGIFLDRVNSLLQHPEAL